MQSEYINNNPQDKILNNGLLFNTIRKHKAPNEKQKKILKYLDRGADINASDANDKYNTPLHIAVIKAEKDIVTFLLDHGANATIKNNDGQTAVDIAQQYSKEIYDLLRHNITKKLKHKEENKGDIKTIAVLKQSKENEQVKQQKGNSKIISELNYQKRKGTSGLSGHLYETKLLTLILLRAELNKDLDEFYLGTNIEGLGAFDDIIFRYKRNGSQESKTIFLQAKHKDDPVNDKIKVEDLYKQNGDFCFQKYFDSYLEINKKIGSKINDVIFKGSTLTDCEFIIYTSATENFCKKKTREHSDEECFIETCKNGTVGSVGPNPIDPQATTYCVVASHRKNYTSLCAAQHDIKTSRMENKSNRLSHDDGKKSPRLDNGTKFSIFTDVDNKINIGADNFNMYDGNFNNVFRRKKFGRSTKVTDEDPVIACVGGRTHHLIENLDPSTTYFVSVFGVAKDRRSGSLLATGSVRPRTSTTKRLKENTPSKTDIRGRNVFYFKATVGTGGGLWLTVTTCGGAVDVEVLVRGKRLYMARNIDPHAKFFVPAPISTTSVQETSDEGSIQFDSSSEEARMRFVIKVVPSRWDRDGTVGIELTASTTRWGVGTPELTDGASIVRELRPKRSCRSVDVAFLPASHNATDVIRYCILAREIMPGEVYVCWSNRKSSLMKSQCTNHGLKSAKVIRQKLTGLKAGRKYAIQVMASNKGYTIPYNILYVDTNISCKED